MRHFKTMPYTKKQLYNVYYKIIIDKILDDLDWTSQEMCCIVYDIVNDKLKSTRNYQLSFKAPTLIKIYLKEVEKMNISDLEFARKYSFDNKEHGVKELIAILHNIITSQLEKRSIIFEKLKTKK